MSGGKRPGAAPAPTALVDDPRWEAS